MLGNKEAIATVAVKDLKTAKKFYEGTIGLTPLPSQEQEVLNYRTGNSTLLVYRSQFAGTRKRSRS